MGVAVAGPSDRERRTPEDEQGLSNLARGYQQAAPYMAASTSLVAAVGAFSWAGWWLDGKLGHRTPWLLVVGAVLGMVGGFISFFRIALGAGKKK
jgi:ATP synthase protein I